ncbi:MAG: PilZ domain-containing protein [Candidatus Kuenenia sp.]|nr:PilZ domain-containing protein [Candidatus Kuenenia hertensis]
MTNKRTDRRKYQRVTPKRDNPVRVDINGENFLDVLYALDISENGISISVPYAFEGCRIDKGVQIVVELPSPVKKYFTANGRIRRISGSTFGVEFVGLKEKDSHVIKEYISSQIGNN